jgi:transcription initiation factor TFIID subunit 10
MHFAKVRTTTQQAKLKTKDKKVVLTMEDLSAALAEHGVNVKKPEYYV